MQICHHILGGTATKVPSFSLKALLPEDHSKFYHYKGSLTTPPCYESVKWIVNKNTISVSEDQVNISVFLLCTVFKG